LTKHCGARDFAKRKDIYKKGRLVMKKLMLVLAVVLMAVPAMAAVTITASDAGSCTAAINYTSTGTLPRAFALDITVNNGAVITGVDVAGAQPFNIYMGTIVIDATGVVTNPGTPVAPAGVGGALGGIGTSGITIEMGSLYDKNATPVVGKPAASGLLIKVTVDKSCHVSLASNVARGNVVLEDATVVAPTLVGADITCQTQICKGDFDGDGFVTTDDLALMISSLRPYAPDYAYECANPANCPGDFDGDGFVTTDDLALMISSLRPYAPDYAYECGSN
jgi:hypothetical protein